jgi:hypothetical protein
MALMNNFLGFSENDDRRTDGIFGLFNSAADQPQSEEDDYEEDDAHLMNYNHTRSNEDLLNVLDNKESNRNLSVSDLYSKYAKKKVTFSTD